MKKKIPALSISKGLIKITTTLIISALYNSFIFLANRWRHKIENIMTLGRSLSVVNKVPWNYYLFYYLCQDRVKSPEYTLTSTTPRSC